MKRWKAIMHFNKPEAAKGNPWTVHWRGACYAVRHIKCNAPMISEWKPNKKTNPRAFFTAQVASLRITSDGIAVLE